jgi:hypothetical protein
MYSARTAKIMEIINWINPTITFVKSIVTPQFM